MNALRTFGIAGFTYTFGETFVDMATERLQKASNTRISSLVEGFLFTWQ
jgi:hypothetical protein